MEWGIVMNIPCTVFTSPVPFIWGSTLYLGLCDSATEEARCADIDRMEIRDVPGISHNIAVNTIILKFHDCPARPSGYMKRIPVRLVGQPDISTGSIALLKKHFQRVEQQGA